MSKRILVIPTTPELGGTRPLSSLAHDVVQAYAAAAASPPGPAA
jgi:hypothetical protein